MELKVWVDGIQRVVCGISDQTTCQEVIYALAHATGKTGRFVLVEKWRTSERSLSPHDKPLELLLKWGEYSNDVQFVLRCLEESSCKSPASLRALSPLGVNPSVDRPQSNVKPVANATVGGISNKRPVVRGPTPTLPETQRLKPYFVDASRPAPESGTLRPQQQQQRQAPVSQHQQHVRYGSEIPQNLAVQQTTVLAGITNSNRPESRNGRAAANNLGLTVLSQSAHENLSASAFGGVGNNSSLMESSFSSSDLHNMSGASCQSSLSSGSRRQPVPPSPSQLHPGSVGAKGSSPGRRRPPPPSYEQVMNHRRNYTNLLISPTQSATGSRSGTPVITSTNTTGQAPSLNLFGHQISSSSSWPANRDHLLKIVESQQNLITQQENKIRAIDNLLDIEKQKLIETENQYYSRDSEQMQKEIQQLEVRRVHIKQNVEDLRRQEFDVQMSVNRQNYIASSAECRTLKEKASNFDREILIKQNIVEKLNLELNKDFVSSGSEYDSGIGSDLNEFDAKLIEFEEMIREKKKLIEKLENTLAKESSLDLLTNSLSNLKQLQIDNNNHNGQQDKSMGAMIKETTPGVWV